MQVRLPFIIAFFAVFIITAWLLSISSLYYFFPVLSDRGVFGDSFGAVNSLFSGLAFVGIICTILLQREDIRIQAKELLETRNEIKEQNKTLRIQRFENTFFKMIDLYYEIVLNSKIVGKDKDVTGRGCFHETIEFLRVLYDHEKATPNILEEVAIKNAYERHYNYNNLGLAHYYRNLYRIFKFIDETDLVEDKKFYTDIIRAQLSNSELLLLFYNATFSEYGRKFKYYLEKYEILDNLDRNSLFHISHSNHCYIAAEAFGCE